MAQLISTGCKREQAEQSWVSGLVLANTGTSLAQPCCAHRLIGSEPWHVSTEPFSCLFSLFPLLITIFIPSSWSLLLFKALPFPCNFSHEDDALRCPRVMSSLASFCSHLKSDFRHSVYLPPLLRSVCPLSPYLIKLRSPSSISTAPILSF